MGQPLVLFGEYLAHSVRRAPRGCVVVVGVALEGERCGGVPSECLEVAGGLAALGEQGETAMAQVVEADGGRPSCSRSGLELLLTLPISLASNKHHHDPHERIARGAMPKSTQTPLRVAARN